MKYETLVVDATYTPMYRTPWEDAVCLIHKGLVYVVAEYEDEIHSPSITMKVPAVVVFKQQKATRRKSVKFSRENIYLRDNGACQYCGNHVTRDEFTYEHIVPRVSGGKTNWENIVVACVKCNQKKGGRTPEQAGMKLLKKPVKPKELPGVIRWSMRYRDGMPEIWRTYLDWEYWSAELEESK